MNRFSCLIVATTCLTAPAFGQILATTPVSALAKSPAAAATTAAGFAASCPPAAAAACSTIAADIDAGVDPSVTLRAVAAAGIGDYVVTRAGWAAAIILRETAAGWQAFASKSPADLAGAAATATVRPFQSVPLASSSQPSTADTGAVPSSNVTAAEPVQPKLVPGWLMRVTPKIDALEGEFFSIARNPWPASLPFGAYGPLLPRGLQMEPAYEMRGYINFKQAGDHTIVVDIGRVPGASELNTACWLRGQLIDGGLPVTFLSADKQELGTFTSSTISIGQPGRYEVVLKAQCIWDPGYSKEGPAYAFDAPSSLNRPARLAGPAPIATLRLIEPGSRSARELRGDEVSFDLAWNNGVEPVDLSNAKPVALPATGTNALVDMGFDPAKVTQGWLVTYFPASLDHWRSPPSEAAIADIPQTPAVIRFDAPRVAGKYPPNDTNNGVSIQARGIFLAQQSGWYTFLIRGNVNGLKTNWASYSCHVNFWLESASGERIELANGTFEDSYHVRNSYRTSLNASRNLAKGDYVLALDSSCSSQYEVTRNRLLNDGYGAADQIEVFVRDPDDQALRPLSRTDLVHVKQ
jgi:hypothetical protein